MKFLKHSNLQIKKGVPKVATLVLPNTPVVAVNLDHVNVLEPSDDNNFQHQKDISSDEKVAMLLKTVPPSRENKPDQEVFINIVPNTPVDTVFVDRGSVDTTSELCETPFSSHYQIRRRERQKESKKQKGVNKISLVDNGKYSPRLVTV